MEQLRDVIRQDNAEYTLAGLKGALEQYDSSEKFKFSFTDDAADPYAMVTVAHWDFRVNLVDYANNGVRLRLELLQNTCRIHAKKFSNFNEAVSAFYALHVFLKCTTSPYILSGRAEYSYRST